METEQEYEGFAWPVFWRRFGVCAGIFLVVFGIGLIRSGVRRQEEVQEKVLCSYELRTESSSRVHLLPNGLYGEPWLEAGNICASSLTDYVELVFSAGMKAKKDQGSTSLAQEESSGEEKTQDSQSEETSVTLQGSGTATAVLRGYQASGDGKKDVYVQKTVLREQDAEVSDSAGGAAAQSVDITLRIRPEDYLARAEEADRILGGSVSRELTILFEGSFQVEAAGKTEDESFSCEVSIPLAASGSFYEITPSEPDTKTGEITEKTTVTKPVRAGRIAAGAAGILAGFILGWFVLCMTCEPDERQQWVRSMRTLLRKYGSRLLCVEKLPDTDGKEVIRLCDIEGLIQAAEELRSPVLYAAEESGLPRDGRFLVSGEPCCYEVVLQAETAPLVEDEGDESGK